MTWEAVADIKHNYCQGRTITVKIRFSDFQTLTRGNTIPGYTDSEEELRKAAFACLKRIALRERGRLIGILLSNPRRKK